MKKVNLLVVFVALGVLAWMMPAQTAQAGTLGSAITTQQEEPAEPAAEQAEAQSSQVFMGKIVQHDGTYVLESEGNKVYQLDDQEKAKEFEGKNVKISGTLDEQSSTIHVAEIEEMEAEE